MWRSLIIAGLLVFTGVPAANAEMDALTEMTLMSFREATQTPLKTADKNDLALQAKYLMQVKNGMSLYKDGVLETADKVQLQVLIKQQLTAADSAISGSKTVKSSRKLAEMMRESALEANQLLSTDVNSPAFGPMLEKYQSGIGYDAYRFAQDQGIEQL